MVAGEIVKTTHIYSEKSSLGSGRCIRSKLQKNGWPRLLQSKALSSAGRPSELVMAWLSSQKEATASETGTSITPVLGICGQRTRRRCLTSCPIMGMVKVDRSSRELFKTSYFSLTAGTTTTGTLTAATTAGTATGAEALALRYTLTLQSGSTSLSSSSEASSKSSLSLTAISLSASSSFLEMSLSLSCSRRSPTLSAESTNLNLFLRDLSAALQSSMKQGLGSLESYMGNLLSLYILPVIRAALLYDSDKSFPTTGNHQTHFNKQLQKCGGWVVVGAMGRRCSGMIIQSLQSMSVNHVMEINGKHYLVRQQTQKILLLTFPSLQPVQKYYINVSHSYLNAETRELLVLYQNEVTILRPAVAPLQLVKGQQAFVDWEPQGGILLANAVVLFGAHSVVFYTRGSLVEKAWEIDIVQDIECLRSTPTGDCLAMKVRAPDNSLFLWNTADPSVRPSQEIILTQSIAEWHFVDENSLAILTRSEFRFYRREGRGGQFNLFHFYQLAARTFAWVARPAAPPPARQSISTLLLLGRRGECSVLELPGVERRTELSEARELGRLRLQYKEVSMRRVVAAWGEEGRLALVCETKNRALFTFLLSSSLRLELQHAYEDLLGTDINAVSCLNDAVLARDRSRWRLFKLHGVSNLTQVDEADVEKAFIYDDSTILCLEDQSLSARRQGKALGEPIPFKYSDPERVQYIGHSQGFLYLIAGIRFYRWGEGVLTVCGVALRNERAVLVEANAFARTLLFKIGEQFMLLSYRIDGQKVTAGSLKSSPHPCIGLSNGLWAQKLPLEVRVGAGEKVLASFSLGRLLKMLECENQAYEYSLQAMAGDGLVVILKNYAFFLQLAEDEKGYEVVLLKRLNSLLYRRFSPHAHPLRLVDPRALTFWAGNQVIRVGPRTALHAAPDPFALPETLLGKQLDLHRVFPPHHPRLLLALIETNRFQLLFQLLHRVYDWFRGGQGLGELYQRVGVDFLGDCEWAAREDSLSLFPEQRLQQEQKFLRKFSEELLESPERILLKEKNPLVLEALLSSLAATLANAKSVDYFSQSVLLLLRTPLRPKWLNSMQVVLLAHSLNKEEAVGELRGDRSMAVSWEWVRGLSLPLWYDNREELRKIIEEVAANEYRAHKDPFDCLFWYLLVGKRSLVATLFKNHRLNSKEHDAAANFLLRDFAQPKDRTAAVKNAYVLIDKKRYLHAMAFFILGGAIDDCIRLSVDRLRDLSLAYAFVLFFREANSAYLLAEMGKGDVWMRHLAHRFTASHINSYNALFQSEDPAEWTYTPELACFHPLLPHFALKLRGSVGVRRELEAQNAKTTASQDIFADFYGEQSSQAVVQQSEKVSLEGDPESFKEAVVRYYLRQGLPVLALLEGRSQQQALENYSYERYKLSGQVDASMEQTITGLEDKLALARCLLATQQLPRLLDFLRGLQEEFAGAVGAVGLGVVVQTKKHVLGELMRLGFQGEQLLGLLKSQGALWGDHTQDFQRVMKDLRQLSVMSKVIACLLLRDYEDVAALLESMEKGAEEVESEGFWGRLKSAYDHFHEARKEKSVKQMDHFEHAFIAVRRQAEEEGALRGELQITREEAVLLLLRLLVLQFLVKSEAPLKEEVEAARRELSHCLKHWMPADVLQDIVLEFKTLIREGSQAKIKLNLLRTVFEDQFVSAYDIVALAHGGYFEERAAGGPGEGPTELLGIEVFRNRNDGVRSFTINQYDTRGLECIVMFRKGLKKFEVCENLANRERNKDSLALLAEDSFYTSPSSTDPRTIERGKYPAAIQRALAHILEERQEEEWPRGWAAASGKEYLRQVEPPYLDYNELNSIECHPALPFFLIGGKGYVQLAHLSSLKNFDRIRCPSVAEIIRLHSSGQRVGVADSAGSLAVHVFDNKFLNPCVFQLKKAGVVDFAFMRPSVLAVLSSNAVQVYDTLLHPKRQLKFKQPFTKDPISVAAVDETRLAVLRKNEVLIYDIRMERLESSKELKGKGKSMLVQGRHILVGQSDCKVRVCSVAGEEAEMIKLGVLDEKDRERTAVEEIHAFNDILLASTTEGSIYYLPRLAH